VPDATFAGLVAPVEVLDPDVAVLDDAGAALPEQRPDLARGRGDLERVGMVLHAPRLSIAGRAAVQGRVR